MTMPEYATHAEEHGRHVVSPISVTWVVLASLVCAVGIFLLFWGGFMESWPFFVIGPLSVLVGFLMLLHPRAGLDHA